MHDIKGQIIYIGKAKNLKKRVKSYFNKTRDSRKLAVMVPQITCFDFILTDTEVEALILESHLIKKHQPKYNVLLKDDKKFPWFLITEEDYPRIIVTRKTDKKTLPGKYFGPYTNARAMYSTLELVKKLFPLKQCRIPRFKDRPCIYNQIGKCLAPCQKLVTPEEYKEIVKRAEMFLSGKQNELSTELKRMMEFYAEKQEFEKAAKYRDSYFDVLKVAGKQKVVSENTDMTGDIIGIACDSSLMSVALLKIREGRLIAKEDFDIELNRIHSSDEALIMFLREYYGLAEKSEIPKELLLPSEIEAEERNVIKERLSLIKGAKVNILSPKIGKKRELIETANKNAASRLEHLKLIEMNKLQNDWNKTGAVIQKMLNLPNFPARIECFDISHIQGTNTVAGMAVFINGKSYKTEYRKYKIRTLKEGRSDDFAAIREVLKRRCGKILKEVSDEERNKETDVNLIPDLIIIDGGKGQLSSALEITEEFGLGNIPVVSLAKKREEVFIPGKSKPVMFPDGSESLFFFQQIRDEAHRFAINYHRKLREKNAVKSILDDIPSLQISYRKILIEHFGDIPGIINATKSELCRVIGKYRGIKVYNFLHKEKKELHS